jgi:hypothetical protein
LKTLKEVESGINILYTRESLWIEKTLQMGGKSYEGRDEGGVMKSALAYFEALSEAGLQANFKEISEFDFSEVMIIKTFYYPCASNLYPIQILEIAGCICAERRQAYCRWTSRLL